MTLPNLLIKSLTMKYFCIMVKSTGGCICRFLIFWCLSQGVSAVFHWRLVQLNDSGGVPMETSA